MYNRDFTIFIDPKNLLQCRKDIFEALEESGWKKDSSTEEYFCDSSAGHVRFITDKSSYTNNFTFIRVEVYDKNKDKPKTFMQLHILNVSSIHICGNHITIIFKNAFSPDPNTSFDDVVYNMWEVNVI